jgi:hypothetical protein
MAEAETYETGDVVLDLMGRVFKRSGHGRWLLTGDSHFYDDAIPHRPLTLLVHEGKVVAR